MQTLVALHVGAVGIGAVSSLLLPVIARFANVEVRAPFDQLRDGKASSAKILIEDWLRRGHSSNTLASRLKDLVDLAAEEYPDTEIPGGQMLESVLGFFRSRHDVLPPSLTLTSSGHVWAQWAAAGSRTAAIEFRRDGSVNLVAFFPDPEEPLRSASMANNLSWKAASREIRNNQSLSWLLAD